MYRYLPEVIEYISCIYILYVCIGNLYANVYNISDERLKAPMF